VSVPELEEFLLALAKADKSKDVRSMAAAAYANMVQPQNQFGANCTQFRNWWRKSNGRPDGELSQSINYWLSAQVRPVSKDSNELTRAVALTGLAAATKGDARWNRTIADASLNLLSSKSDVSLSALAMSLDLDRFKAMSENDPVKTAEFCNKTLEMICLPDPKSITNRADERATIGLINIMTPLLSATKSSQRQEFVEHLSSLINPLSGKGYALYYPQLREAAISALTALGDRRSETLVVDQLNSTSNKGDIPAPGADPGVRLAAVKYLKNVDNRTLGRLKPQLMKGESDPAVALELQSIVVSQ